MIRIATEKDIPAMLEIYRPYVEETTCSFEYDLPCRNTFTRRFCEHTAQFPWLVWEENGEVQGYAYAGAPWERAGFRWSAEVSVYLSRKAHRKGIGRALYARLEEILSAQGYRMVYAVITSENTASLAFHAACGYHFAAEFPNCGFKQSRWLGVTWMAKDLNPELTPQAFPGKWRDCL